MIPSTRHNALAIHLDTISPNDFESKFLKSCVRLRNHKDQMKVK